MTSAPLCAAPRCRIPGRHRDGCDPDCRGCQPATAADGSRLCPLDIRRLGENPVKAAELHGELELVLKAAGAGERTPSKPGSGTPPRDVIVAMRGDIRHYLTWWAKRISKERGISLPADEVTAIGGYVARHAEWLAAHKLAGYAADEMAGLVSRAWGLAYPSGTRRLSVGPCPLCGGIDLGNRWVGERLPPGFIGPPRRSGRLEALVREREKCIKHERLDCPDRLCRAQDLLPSEVFCDMVDEHRWPATAWGRLDRLVMARKRAAA